MEDQELQDFKDLFYQLDQPREEKLSKKHKRIDQEEFDSPEEHESHLQ